jgi:hypothetical protein
VGVRVDKYWNVIRNALGSAATYANRMNLVAMTPQSSLSSTGFCLANAGVEYLVYQPASKPFTLRMPAGTYQFEWFNPSTNMVTANGPIIVPGGNQSFTAPFAGDAVLYLHAPPK